MIAITEHCKYVFTQSELVELARAQARHMGEMEQAEQLLDRVKADHKSTVTRIDNEISDCTRKVTSGYDMRLIRCLLLKFRPDPESALIVRTDNGRVLRKRKLEAEEKQLTLTTEAPPPWVFEIDLYADSVSDVAELVAEGVPITESEAKELQELHDSGALKFKPTRKLIEDGKPPKKGK